MQEQKSLYNYETLTCEGQTKIFSTGAFCAELDSEQVRNVKFFSKEVLSEYFFELCKDRTLTEYNLVNNIFIPMYGNDFLGVKLPKNMLGTPEEFDLTKLCNILCYLIEANSNEFLTGLLFLRFDMMSGDYNNNCISILIKYKDGHRNKFFTVTYYTNITNKRLDSHDNAFINLQDIICEIIKRVISCRISYDSWSSITIERCIHQY